MFTIALYTRAKIWKQRKCPSTDEWVKKMWCVCVYIHTDTHTHTHRCTHTEKYYLARRRQNLPFAITWVNLEGIRPSEIS